MLAPGIVKYKVGEAETQIFVRGGFAEVTPAGLTILAEEAIPVAELNKEDLARRLENAKQDLADAESTPQSRDNAQRELDQLTELQAAL